MLFQHINRHADKHRKRVYLVLVVIIGLSFVVWVTPRGCDGTNRPGTHSKVGQMFGKAITQGEFLAATQRAVLGHYLSNGQWLGGGRNDNDQLTAITVQRLMALRVARRQGIDAVSNEEFMAYVKSRPVLQKDGAFDSESLKNFRDNVTRSLRLTGAEFDQAFRENIIIDRLEAEATRGVIVSPVEVHDAFVQRYEEFTVSTADVKLNATKNGDPSQAELDAYFATHQQELLTAASKVFQVAVFPISKDLSKITVPEERIKRTYEREAKLPENKDRTLDERHDEIRDRLARSDAFLQASAAARRLSDDVTKDTKDASQEALLKRFAEAAAKAGVKVAETPAILPTDTVVKGFEDAGTFAYVTRELDDKVVLGSPVRGTDNVYLPVYLKTIPGTVPEKLDQVRADVVEAVLNEKGKALYQEKILPHADEVKGMPDTQALNELARKAWEASADKELEERRQIYKDKLALVNRYLMPAFKPEQRTASVVKFEPEDFLEAAAKRIDEKQVEYYYKSNLAEYEKKETRASQIVVKVPASADDAMKAKLRARAEGLLAKIREKGESFAEVAMTSSEDDDTRRKSGDMGYAEIGKRPADIESVLAGLQVGEISDVVETTAGFAILQLTDRRDGRSLDDVKVEIRTKLEQQEAQQLAQDKAADLSDEMSAALDRAMGALGDEADDAARLAKAQQVFTETVKAQKLEIIPVDTPTAEAKTLEIIQIDTPFARNEDVGSFGRDATLAKAIFELDPAMPISNAVGANSPNSPQFVALLGQIIPGRLYSLDTEADILLPKLRQIVSKDLAREAARAEAAALRDAWTEALAKGDVPAVINGVMWKTSKPFSLMEPDYQIPQLGEVYEVASKAKSGTMFDPIEYENGFIVARLDARTLPAETQLTEDVKKELEENLKKSKTDAALTSFYQRLGREAETSLFGEPYPKQN